MRRQTDDDMDEDESPLVLRAVFIGHEDKSRDLVRPTAALADDIAALIASGAIL
jgi:hypothetical protein